MTIKTHNGFTLIELVVVIILLGILAITALPQFINLSSDTNRSVIKSLAASMKATAQLQHQIAQVNSGNGGLTNGFVHNDVTFDKGYPIGVSHDPVTQTPQPQNDIPEILEAMNIDLSSYTYSIIFNGTGSSGGLTRDLYMSTLNVIANGATAQQIMATNCYVSYQSYVIEVRPPEIAAIITSC
ncbi:MAG: type II secretion system protein [Parashewanella sp.]